MQEEKNCFVQKCSSAEDLKKHHEIVLNLLNNLRLDLYHFSDLMREDLKVIKTQVEKNGQYEKISLRAVIVIIALAYILFLGEKVKDILNIDFLKLLLLS